MAVCCECCVLSGRGLCAELIIRREESYRLWCVVMCDLETSWMRRHWPHWGLSRQNKNKLNKGPWTSKQLLIKLAKIEKVYILWSLVQTNLSLLGDNRIHFSVPWSIFEHELSCLGVFTFCTCYILICLVCVVASFKLSCVYCCSCLVCIVVFLCVFVALCIYCCFYFRCWTAGKKSVFGRSCDRPPRHRFFMVSLCL